jgi:hypothetical protein
MSLDWSTEKCACPAPAGKAEADERDGLIFATAAVGLSSVTRDNEREWLVRIRVLEDLGRKQLLGQNPLGVLERWIGLETNADDETREEWTAVLLAAAFERAESMADRVFKAPAGLRPMSANTKTEV